MESLTTECLALGFGKCKLQVQVPASGGIEHVEDLAGKKIATSFDSIARQYFGEIDDRLGTKTVVEYLSGSVETACALGLADGIVDLVESGETMRAAGLKPIGTIMSSEAVLISSSTPKKIHMLSVGEQLRSRIAGVVASAKYILCQYNIRRTDLSVARKITPGRRSATVSALDDAEVRSHVTSAGRPDRALKFSIIPPQSSQPGYLKMVYTIIVHLQASSLENAEKLSQKLVEAASTYRKDKETLAWLVHRDPKDPLKFAIVERFLNEGSQKYHLENPYWATFDPYVQPLLSHPIHENLTRWEELEVSVKNQDSA
ncbi:ATP phosphoribosyltransferase [Rhizoctonia solani]|uniref:ATP phosphoribosyltransferase n=1 Tax=Rhizoctonia solani TaxID=456999 RepID=A0A0K6FZW4_9AGAM|nr:ATP phosphoribosyltransferase [Rhizoctonia solani]